MRTPAWIDASLPAERGLLGAVEIVINELLGVFQCIIDHFKRAA